ncbi:unnamed protein product [Urochloa decumbens]|uniref:Peptidase C1A papain C-terminal domain-containing protein n=1 Tax=Urochloa decumbens TaxID=240449 RepID=A0ABC8VGE2_9POAL
MAVGKLVVFAALLLCLAGTAVACIPPPKWAIMPDSDDAPPPVVFPAAPAPRPVVDWRARGAVTAPKNQGWLDSCWAMAAVGAIEGLHTITTGKLVSLSSQEVFDCADPNLIHSRPKAFDWVVRNGGVASEADYPYMGREQECKRQMLNKIAASIKGYMANVNSEADLLMAVARQPVAIKMRLDPATFSAYRGGLFTGPCGDDLHAMLLVGHGSTSDGKRYWIIKNSYGVHWGDKGYLYVQRGPDSGVGLCGLAYNGAYPTN